MDNLTMLTCDHCGGKSFAGGIFPRKGRTRGELMDLIRSRGKVTELCRHCNHVSVLRVKPLEQGAHP